MQVKVRQWRDALMPTVAAMSAIAIIVPTVGIVVMIYIGTSADVPIAVASFGGRPAQA